MLSTKTLTFRDNAIKKLITQAKPHKPSTAKTASQADSSEFTQLISIMISKKEFNCLK
jgi:hypothetical protein